MFADTVKRLALSLITVSTTGCMLGTSAKHYRTRAAEPHRQTELAASESSRAARLLKAGSIKNAEGALQKALAADVTYGPAHNNLGHLLFQQRKYYLSAWEFEYAMKLMPDRAEPRNNLGLVFEAVGKLDQAVSVYSEAVALDPSSQEYLGNYVRARIRRGDTKEELQLDLENLLLHETRPHWRDWVGQQVSLIVDSPLSESKLQNANNLSQPMAPVISTSQGIDGGDSTPSGQITIDSVVPH